MKRPFRLEAPQARLDWIARRVADAVIGYAPDDDADWKYGTDARYLAEFRDYWRDRYDWGAAQDAFNAFPQYRAEIEGIDVHFYHLPATTGEAGFPIILSHGWPGSVLEYLEAMPLLAARGYDVVVPSLPGYGFSARPPRPIGAAHIARMWRTLMVDALGYSRFGAQGGDWGASMTTARPTDGGPCRAPMGFAHFPGETPPPPRSAAEKRFNVVHWANMPRGGHFAAWEEPEIFAAEVAGFFDRWR